ncbi:16S rRNA (guanine(527)-N(7))-methyltransferase RsmG [Yoonia sp.]|uniref:16S rRNA (guanine(527)-N(7))-methyltransferase RsmG n=1 Tax=Yoonia sp. TaxID=2212373 RepID=UPI0023B5E0A0
MNQSVGGVDVSRETIARLELYSQLVTKWTPKINLIARSSITEIWNRHIIDSAQLYRFAPDSYGKWVDLGSGAGFPGIVMAIIAIEKQPGAEFVLIESDQRKATFLRTAAREIGLKVSVLADRIENLPQQTADIVSARALTSLSGLLALSERHIARDGVCLFHKGKQAEQELAEARAGWRFALEDHASLTDPEARLLAIQRIEKRGK